jgi:nucleoside-diphosphate-sugar epimerase
MTPQNVLVTGSSGFIGHPVARALAEMGRQVIGLDPAPPGHEILGVTSVRGELGDVRQMSELLRSKEIDTVVHAGGISGPMLARDDPYLICEANVWGHQPDRGGAVGGDPPLGLLFVGGRFRKHAPGTGTG